MPAHKVTQDHNLVLIFPSAAATEGFFCTTSLEATPGSKGEKKKDKDIEGKRIEKRS